MRQTSMRDKEDVTVWMRGRAPGLQQLERQHQGEGRGGAGSENNVQLWITTKGRFIFMGLCACALLPRARREPGGGTGNSLEPRQHDKALAILSPYE